MTTIKVIEIQQYGKACYVKGSHCLDPNSVVGDPIHARNFADDEIALKCVLTDLHVEGDSCYAKSGIYSETLPQVVTFEVEAKEINRTQGRELQ